MTERPILFNGDMVRAILDGRKTQTRRPIDLGDRKPNEFREFYQDNAGVWWADDGAPYGLFRCPFGGPGDLLWVRETMWISGGYVATDPPPCRHCGKRPSIHMPRIDSRITLLVKRVWAERVQSISEADAQAEGLWPGLHCTATELFRDVWVGIYPIKHPWADNPWEFACEFEEKTC